MYIYIYIYIYQIYNLSATVPWGRSGRGWSTCPPFLVFWCAESQNLVFLSLSDPHGITCVSRAPFWTPLLHLFSDLLFNNEHPFKISSQEPKSSQESNNSEHYNRNTPTANACKNTLWEIANLWNWQPLQHSNWLPKDPDFLKEEQQTKPKWNPRQLQITKTKTSTNKVRGRPNFSALWQTCLEIMKIAKLQGANKMHGGKTCAQRNDIYTL